MNTKYNTANQAKNFLLSHSTLTLERAVDIINMSDTDVIKDNQGVYFSEAPEGKKILPIFNLMLGFKSDEIKKLYRLYPDCDKVIKSMPLTVQENFYNKLRSKVK